jgi:hypothetical protein
VIAAVGLRSGEAARFARNIAAKYRRDDLLIGDGRGEKVHGSCAICPTGTAARALLYRSLP